MKVLLLNPPHHEKTIKEGRCEQKGELFETVFPPLQMAYLAAILKKKAEVKILDCIAQNISIEHLTQLYISEKPDKVFVNTTTKTIKNDLVIVKKLNKLNNAEFILNGISALYFRKRLSQIKGIIVPKNIEEYAYNLIGEKSSGDLDDLPFPAWDMIDLGNYRIPLTGEKFVLLQTSTGCPYDCVFCTVPFYHGKRIVKRSINSVVNEILYIKRLGIDNILFFADNFAVDKLWVRKLCKEIIKKRIKINFFCNSRVDTIDKETLALMKKAGCWLISLGIESGNQRILDAAKKRIKVQDIRKAVSEANLAGILTLGNFVIGLPGENESSLKDTIKLANDLKLDFAVFNIAVPLPGSGLYQKYRNKNLNTEKSGYSSQAILQETDLRHWQRKAYISFYSKRPVGRFLRIIRIMGLKNIVHVVRSALYLVFQVLI